MSIVEDLKKASAEGEIKQARREIPSYPKGWEPAVEDHGDGTVEAVSVPLDRANVEEEELIRNWDLDPALWRIVGKVGVRRWQNAKGDWQYSYKADLVATNNSVVKDYSDLINEIKKYKPKKSTPPTGDTAFAVFLADIQLGKPDGYGVEGTVQRCLNIIGEVEERVKDLRKIGRKLGTLYVFGMGDLVEGCDGHYCVDASTPILTDDLRWVPAGELKAGDGLYAFNEEGVGPRGRRYEKSTVLSNKIENMQSVRVEFSDGSHLVCTPEHPLLTCGDSGKQKKSKFTAASDLTVGMRVAKICDPWETGTSRDDGWLAGIYDGEGSLSGNKDRTGPNVLGVSQKPGAVNDKIRSCLDERGFSYTSVPNTASGVVNTRLRGGYPEVLRALGTLRPERLLSKIGEPYMQSQWVDVVSVTEIGESPIARLGTSSKTYFANGFASHNSQQTFGVELNRRDQVKMVRRLITKMLARWADLFETVVVTCVGGNHGENRKNGKSFTDFADNDDVAIFEQIAEIFEENPGRYGHVKFFIPNDELALTLDVCGTITTIMHGHLGRAGATAQTKQINWWKNQAHGLQSAGDSTLLVTAHYHHFTVTQQGAKMHIQCPALEDRSDWWVDVAGQDAPPGVVTMTIGGGTQSDILVLNGD